MFIIRADGTVVGEGSGGFWKSDVLGTVLQPGDAIIVPEKVVTDSTFWRNVFNTAQLTSAIALTANLLTNF